MGRGLGGGLGRARVRVEGGWLIVGLMADCLKLMKWAVMNWEEGREWREWKGIGLDPSSRIH